MQNNNIYPFDIFVVETAYITADNAMKLFLYTLSKHCKSVSKFARIVICINSATKNQCDNKFNLLLMINNYLHDFNVEIIDIGYDEFKKLDINQHWNEKTNCRHSHLYSISHGCVISEYLKYANSSGVLFSLLTHSDIEFLSDIYQTIFKWQQMLIADKNIAGIELTKHYTDEKIKTYESMDSSFSLWKTPVLHQYAIFDNIPFYAVDKRLNGDYFYDTGSMIKKKIKENYKIITDSKDVPIKHWCSLSSWILYGENDQIENAQNRMQEIKQHVLNLKMKDLDV